LKFDADRVAEVSTGFARPGASTVLGGDLFIMTVDSVTPRTAIRASSPSRVAAALAKIEAHPALQLTPEAFAYEVRQARDAAQQQGSRNMSAAIQRVDAAGAGLE
jgi:hypothetical protein